MREIKFRAWDTVAKQMAPLSNKFINLGSGYVFENVRDGLEGTDELVYSKRFILMQYTGLKDKSGKEIYGGDIMRIEAFEPQINVVRFDRGGFCIEPVLESPLHSSFWSDIKYAEDDRSEIIGNIYQNPELIK